MTREDLLELLAEMSHTEDKQEDEIDSGDYTKIFRASQSTAVRHLKAYVESGLLISRNIQRGSTSHRFYRFNPDYTGELPKKFADLFSKNGRKPPDKSK